MKICSVLCLVFLVGCSVPVVMFEPIEENMFVTVTIVASYDDFPDDVKELYPHPERLKGCAHIDGRIYVIGIMTDTGLQIEPEVLGHELAHLLSWQNHWIENPDNYHRRFQH